MAELWFQAVTRSPTDRERLASAMLANMLHSEITGYEMMIHAHPTDTALHDDVALLYVQAGNLERAAAHFVETRRLQPDSPAAHYNLGMVLLMQGQTETAVEHFLDALALAPGYARAHDGLGVARLHQGGWARP
jgi:Flp pilus assembly protein TadD